MHESNRRNVPEIYWQRQFEWSNNIEPHQQRNEKERDGNTHTKKCVLMLIFVASKYVSVCKSVRKTIHVSSKSAAFDAET